MQIPLENLIDRVRDLGAMGEVAVSFLSRHRILNACKNHPNIRMTIMNEKRSEAIFLVNTDENLHASLWDDQDPIISRLMRHIFE